MIEMYRISDFAICRQGNGRFVQKTILRTEKLCKTFSTGGIQQHVLKNLDIELLEGNNPRIVFADEPTAALNSASSDSVLDVMTAEGISGRNGMVG